MCPSRSAPSALSPELNKRRGGRGELKIGFHAVRLFVRASRANHARHDGFYSDIATVLGFGRFVTNAQVRCCCCLAELSTEELYGTEIGAFAQVARGGNCTVFFRERGAGRTLFTAHNTSALEQRSDPMSTIITASDTASFNSAITQANAATSGSVEIDLTGNITLKSRSPSCTFLSLLRLVRSQTACDPQPKPK